MKKLLKRIGIVAGITVAAVLIFLVNLLIIINYGPSKNAHKVFVRSCYETSAMKFVAKMFTTDEEFNQILKEKSNDGVEEEIDDTLIHISTPEPTQAPVTGDEPAPTEEPGKNPESSGQAGSVNKNDGNSLGGFDDGYTYKNVIANENGILICKVTGPTYQGHMMVVKDPSRVFVGTCKNIGDSGARGDKLNTIVERYGAVAGVNAGGFADEGGHGTGTIPLGYAISQGKFYSGGSKEDILIGFDNNNILRIGNMTTAEAKEKGIRDAVSFGPALIVNGKPNDLSSGLNPRTAIGQRDDGAVLILVIDGRQSNSLGAAHKDLIEIFLEFKAVNAANLDGGSSSLMIYKGEEVSSKSNFVSDRSLPTAILVK